MSYTVVRSNQNQRAKYQAHITHALKPTFSLLSKEGNPSERLRLPFINLDLLRSRIGITLPQATTDISHIDDVILFVELQTDCFAESLGENLAAQRLLGCWRRSDEVLLVQCVAQWEFAALYLSVSMCIGTQSRRIEEKNLRRSKRVLHPRHRIRGQWAQGVYPSPYQYLDGLSR